MLSPLLLTRRHAVTAAAWARNLCLPPCPSSRRLTVAATAGSTAPAVVPPVPLCQRPAVHEGSVAALLAWRDDVLARVAEIGNTFEQQDNGPSSDELRVCAQTLAVCNKGLLLQLCSCAGLELACHLQLPCTERDFLGVGRRHSSELRPLLHSVRQLRKGLWRDFDMIMSFAGGAGARARLVQLQLAHL